MTVRIVKTEEQCRKFLDTVINVGDVNKKALGFLRAGIYEDALASGRLWILAADGDQYCGHLIFGGALPSLHVTQLYVTEATRGQGLARRLVDELVAYGEEEGYTSIRARVAVDLPANDVWERLGFETVSVVSGGKTTGRMINKRFRRLNPRGKQTHMLEILDGIATSSKLIARGMPINRSRWYTLDLNAWLDFALRRQPFFDAARALIEDASRGRFRLRFTREAKEEALRNSAGRESDPLMAVIETWKAEPDDDGEESEALVQQLRLLVFPNRSTTGRRACNDLSDLRHLAMSIRAGAAGFITREKALLAHRAAILHRFGLDVVSPSDLVESSEPTSAPLTSLNEGLKVELLQNRWPAAANVIREIAGQRARLRTLDREDDGRVCSLGDKIVGVLYWSPSHREDIDAYLAMDVSDEIDVDARQRVLDILLGILVAEARSALRLHRILIRTDTDTSTRHCTDFRRAGFFDTSEIDLFVRFVSGDPIGLDDWAHAKQPVEKELGVDTKWLGNHESGPVLRLSSATTAANLDRFTFETFFGLTALTLGARRSFYVPIKEPFANELLPHAWRPYLFHEHDASFRLERVYFRNPRSTAGLKPGDLLFFYVTRKIGGLIGAARCTASEILDHNEATERFRRLAVLTGC